MRQFHDCSKYKKILILYSYQIVQEVHFYEATCHIKMDRTLRPYYCLSKILLKLTLDVTILPRKECQIHHQIPTKTPLITPIVGEWD